MSFRIVTKEFKKKSICLVESTLNNNLLEPILTRLKKDSVGLLPCSQQEVTQLEDFHSIKFPLVYVEYLKKMGKYFGRIGQGTDCFFDDLFLIKGYAIELLEQNGVKMKLPMDSFVFSMHQGYVFYFFRASEGENPPVYMYMEGDEEDVVFRKGYNSFTDYLTQLLDDFRISM